jgi:hypothetical protein
MNIPKAPLSSHLQDMHLKHIMNETKYGALQGSFSCMPKAVRLCNRRAVTDSHGKLASKQMAMAGSCKQVTSWLAKLKPSNAHMHEPLLQPTAHGTMAACLLLDK